MNVIDERVFWRVALTALLAISTSTAAMAVEPKATSQPSDPNEPVDYNRDVRPILSKTCFKCHGPDAAHRSAGLRLDDRDAAIKPVESGGTAIVPGKPDDSELLVRVLLDDSDDARMPPKAVGERLTPEQVDLLRRWIASGAEYAVHWSLAAPQRPSAPAVSNPDWVRTPIDAFVLAKLDKQGLAPQPEATRSSLIRRLSLDLRGLPPTPHEVRAFLDDPSSNAYEKLVDSMLADSAFGERWARVWLDLARYADSAGYGSDPLRLNMWRYRDWVIDSFNNNKPYDQFTIEQLAGDLLPNPTLDQLMATAFHRNTMTNTEGGTDDEEFRMAAVKDRADVTAQVWLGLTIGCAKCHNHKFDPISQKEYYSFLAYFNQSADADRGDEAPVISAPTKAEMELNAKLDEQIAALEAKISAPSTELDADQAVWETELQGTTTWIPMQFRSAAAESGAKVSQMEDGSFLVSGESVANDVYTVVSRTNLHGVTALRLETIPDPSLPQGGAGRAPDGNFVLSQLSVAQADGGAIDAGTAPSSTPGRFVRVELPGEQRFLHVAELQIFAGGQNLALKGTATQSSTDFGGEAKRAIDGVTNGNFYEANSVTHTAMQANPWLEVDLGGMAAIDEIKLWNRTDGGTPQRLVPAVISVLNADRKEVWKAEIKDPPVPSISLAVTGRVPVMLARSLADFSQDGFPVDSARQQRPAAEIPTMGWAVAPRIAESHSATFIFGEALPARYLTELTVRMEHKFQQPGYTLGRFRLSVTTDPVLLRAKDIPEDILAIVRTAADKRTPEQVAWVRQHFRASAARLQPVRDEIAALQKSRPTPSTLPIMQELPVGQRRKSHVLEKANFLLPTEEVQPTTPAAIPSLAGEVRGDRLDVARWIIDRRNPLTARVAVNRLWSQIFGLGIVETEEDFGMQGAIPSNQPLLDWLAVEWMEPTVMRNPSGELRPWDIKALLRTIVLSSAYRQSSRVTPESLAKDPRNVFLSRGPRFRLEAEMVRDQALALSGLLSRKQHGPSVYPIQPDGLWQAAFNGERTWTTSTGEDRHRRALYTFWRRTVPYPSMAAFDAPSREACTIRRGRTNTPLQAFVTLNDPVYVEAAQALGRRLVAEGGETPAQRIGYGLFLCTARPAEADQVAALVSLFESERAYYSQHKEAATTFAAQTGEPLPAGLSPEDAAAWTVVGNVLLNLDAVLTRN